MTIERIDETMAKIDIISGFLGAGDRHRWWIFERGRNPDYRDEFRLHLLFFGW